MKQIVFLFLLSISFLAQANSIASDALVVHFFTHVQKMQLHFKQTKVIPEIEKSFKTSGIFQFVRDKGIIIKQEKPNVQTFVSTTKKFCFNGKEDFLDNLPYFSDVKSLIDHLLMGNMSDLKEIFEITYFEKNKTWQMDLLPTQKKMKDFIQKVVLKGNIHFIEKLVIEYTDGTKMYIEYSPISQDLTDEIKC